MNVNKRHVRRQINQGDLVGSSFLNGIANDVDRLSGIVNEFDERYKPDSRGGIAIKWVYVVGYAASNMKLSVKDVDSSANPTGDAFEVWAVSYGQTAGTVGIIPLGQALPLFQATDRILVINIPNLVGGGKGWYTLATIIRSCPAPAGGGALTDGGGNGSAILPNPPTLIQKIGGWLFG